MILWNIFEYGMCLKGNQYQVLLRRRSGMYYADVLCSFKALTQDQNYSAKKGRFANHQGCVYKIVKLFLMQEWLKIRDPHGMS